MRWQAGPLLLLLHLVVMLAILIPGLYETMVRMKSRLVAEDTVVGSEEVVCRGGRGDLLRLLSAADAVGAGRSAGH